MPELSVIRTKLAERLARVVSVSGGQSSAYPQVNPTPPALQVMWPDDIEYDVAMNRGGDTWFLIVQGLVADNLNEGAVRRLDRWLASSGSESVKHAVETDSAGSRDRTLDGEVDSLRVTRMSRCGPTRLQGIGDVLVAEWTVQVETSG